jgi:hypothetical protein
MTVWRRVQFALGSACHGFGGPVSQRGRLALNTGPQPPGGPTAPKTAGS